MQIIFWLLILLALVFLSAFFSCSETGMMSVNHYKVRHAAKKGNKAAKRVLTLLKRPDRLLSVILIGNTLANILASSVATMLAVKYFGEMGLVIVTAVLSIVILIFGETLPKTLAAMYAKKVSYAVSFALNVILTIFSPIVFIINTAGNSILKLFGIDVAKHTMDKLSIDELETIVQEATKDLAASPRNMMLRMLSMDDVVVEDIMVARADIHGIDVEKDWDKVVEQIMLCPNSNAPVYNDNIDNVLGILDVRRALVRIIAGDLNKEELLTMLSDVYFIPEATGIDKQLLYFQQRQHSIGFVVDEYGEILGLLTIKDILEEIVGEFEKDREAEQYMLVTNADGSYDVDASIAVRELFRVTEWNLPLEKAATLSGLIIEYLQYIPRCPMCVKIAGYPMEILVYNENTIEQVRVWPLLYRETTKRED
jgi:Mg2+/Co2+ transporter CorB